MPEITPDYIAQLMAILVEDEKKEEKKEDSNDDAE